ncbi:MAG: AbrB/MazE/SpoVT family DNA-binding domain-containing protein [Thermoplasmata archaeon]
MQLKDEGSLISVSHVSPRGSSLRVTLPKEIARSLGIGPRDIVGFYYQNKKIVIRKLK